MRRSLVMLFVCIIDSITYLIISGRLAVSVPPPVETRGESFASSLRPLQGGHVAVPLRKKEGCI